MITMFDDGAFELPNSFDADEIDIFAELGVSGNYQTASANGMKTQQNENLAILLADEEEVSQHADEILVNSVDDLQTFTLPDETISELLEILVKQELQSSEGKEIISNVPGSAKLNPSTAKVTKSENEYEISVIIDVDGSGPVRPYAKIKSENNILKLESAPKSIPSSWIPLHDILIDMLTKAMQALSSTNFTINNNA